ncbi:E3 ubiquitin-protein ligase TRIM39-like [Engraulis encrasicolus]|uniref:E3 ubiquitin-protein ligase TRIM39-like n=1 Tax=Engraulis encrasicolus TaxID=184585 RepID=UPI002FD6A756
MPENEESFNTSRPANKADTICMNEVPKGSQQRTEHGKITDSSGGHYRRYKLAVVLVCVLLLAVTVTFGITILSTKDLQLRYKNLAEEKDQLPTHTNTTAERGQLETKFSAERDELQRRLCELGLKTKDLQLRYKNLAEDQDQLQLQYNNITAEKAQLETKFNAERDKLQRRLGELGLKTKDLQLRYKNLAEDQDQLQFQYNNITAEKVQLETKFSAERDELQRRLCELESHDMKTIKQHTVNVTLDPDTAASNLILSADGKQVKYGDTRQNLPDTPKRFIKYINVLGREGFSSGKFYYEVQVKGKTEWDIGVAKESVNRKGEIFLSPEYGLWTIWLRNGTYKALAGPSVPLSLKGEPQTVGVFVDYGAGLISFYDADCWNHIYIFTNVSFTEKIYPFFSPGLNQGGKNSTPLIIFPVHDCPNK